MTTSRFSLCSPSTDGKPSLHRRPPQRKQRLPRALIESLHPLTGFLRNHRWLLAVVAISCFLIEAARAAEPAPPSFQSMGPQLFTANGYGFPFGLAWGDLNGDGIVDAVSNQNLTARNLVAIHLGRGDGTFLKSVVDTPVPKSAFALGDLNGDGRLDLVLGLQNDGIVQVMLGNGDGSFRSPTGYPIGASDGSLCAIALVDMDGDGKLDVVTGDYAGGVRVAKGDGTGAFVTPLYFAFDQGGVNFFSLNVLDVNGDNRLDIVFAPRGTGGIVMLTNVPTSTAFRSLEFGFPESKTLTVRRESSQKVVWALSDFGSGTGARLAIGNNLDSSISFQQLTTPGVGWTRPIIEDFDRDGLLDIVVGDAYLTQNGSVKYFGGRNLLFAPAAVVSLLPSRGSLGPAADINGDELPDFVVGSQSEIYFSVVLQRARLAITSPDNVTFEEGFPGSFTATALGETPITFFLSGSLPAGVTFSSQGVLAGTPAPNTAGQYLVTTVAANNVDAPVGRNLLLTVTPRQVPRLILPNAQNVTTTSAALNGEVQTDHGFPISRRGVVYAPTTLNANPQLGGPSVMVLDDTTLATGAFGLQANGLLPATRYSFAVFAQNIRGVGYSSVETFFTLPDPNAGSLLVTTLTDENNGNSAPSLGTGTSLREAIAYARTLGGDQTISFLPSLFASGSSTMTLTLGELPILNFTGTLTIAGPGAEQLTISGGNVSRIFRIDNAGARLNGLTLTAGRAADGGAIRNTGTLTVNDCVFAQNTTASTGGAIYQAGGSATVMRCSFLGNSAANPAGNPFTGVGGAINNVGGALWVINSTLYGNSATANLSGIGGAIVTAHGTASTRIINSTIVNNSADSAHGGVAYLSGNVVIQNSIISGNTAPFEANVGSNIDIAGAGNVIGGNPADLFTTAQPANNGGTTPTFALKPGSAAFNAGVNGLATDASLNGLATDQIGRSRIRSGTVDAGSTEFATLPTIGPATLANVTDTSATLGGEVISDGGGLVRRGVLFARTADNATPALGGAAVIVVAVPGSAGVFNTTVNLQPLTTYSFVAFAESELGTVYSGVVTFTTPEFASLVVTTTSDTIDSADGQTSLREAVAYAHSGRAPANTPVTFTPTLISSGPAVLTLANTLTLNGPVTVNGLGASLLTVSGNHTHRVLRVAPGASATLTGVTIADGRVDNATYPEGHGAGVLNEGALTVIDCVFTGHVAGGSARGDGAALYHRGSSLLVQGCTFTGNQANAGGFGASIGADSGTGAILASTFYNNHAQGNAGGIVNYGTALGVTNCTFTSNTADNGAAITHYGNVMTLAHCTIVSNTANFTGGGIERVGRVGNELFLVNNIIAQNTASVGPDAFSYTDNNNGAFTSLGHNLLGSGDSALGFSHGVNGDLVGTTASPLNPQVAPLANNGGLTLTMALLPGSPAVNAGTSTGAPVKDQRGTLRPQFGAVDLGAVEQSPFDNGLTIVLAGGALWYVGPDAIGNDLHIYREVQGQIPSVVDGAARFIGQANDGTVLVRTASGLVFSRPGSTSGAGTGWQQLSSVFAGDGATWFLGPDGTGSDLYLYRWDAIGTPTYSDGAGSQLFSVAGGTVLTRNSSGQFFERIGSSAGFGSNWQLVPGSLVVTTSLDEDNGTSDPRLGTGTSLREALAYAASTGAPQTVTFAPALTAGGPVVLTLADSLSLNGPVTVSGPGAGQVTVSGNNARRVLRVPPGASATLSGLTIADGRVDNGIYPEGYGAGVLNEGALTVIDCVFTGHVAGGSARGDGAALYHRGSSLLVQGCTFTGNQANAGGFGASIGADSGTGAILASTFYNNHAQGNAGGIVNYGTALGVTNCTFTSNTADNGAAITHYGNVMTLAHCTIVSNTANFTGGGIERVGRVGNQLFLVNNVIAQNSAPVGPDAFSYTDNNNGAFTSLGHNLLGNGDSALGFSHGVNGDLVGTTASPLNPQVAPLANNGGSTLTMALLPGSPAINAGTLMAGLNTDQRGLARSFGSAPDLGAFEQIPTIAPPPVITPASGTYVGSVHVSISTTAGGAAIRYTIDGSTPTDTHGDLYTGPFTLSSNATVRAIVTGTGWLTSSEASASYIVQAPLQDWRALHGLPTDGSQDLQNPSGDGVINLLKYAFNLAPNPGDLSVSNRMVLPPGGTAGLPSIQVNAQRHLVFQFVRRKAATNPGLTYVLQISSDLSTWTALDLTGAMVESIDDTWERVTVIDGTGAATRFGRVGVARN